MYWVIGAAANAVMALAYLLIMVAIARPLVRTGQLRQNLLAVATAAIFLTCAVDHAGQVLHLLEPYFGLDTGRGLAMRASFDWDLALWDVVGALVGGYYWTLRRSYSPGMRGATLFEDVRQREDDAIALNDDVLQGLVVAKLALELDEPQRAMAALDASIAAASSMISDLLGSTASPTGLRRSGPATLQSRV